jgi:hypothetical protein
MDFLLEIQGNVIPVEVKSGRQTHAKAYKFFQKSINLDTKIVLSALPLEVHSGKKNAVLSSVFSRELPNIYSNNPET